MPRPPRTAHGSASRTGMALGRVVGANGVAVIADLLGFRVPLEAYPNHEGGLTLGYFVSLVQRALVIQSHKVCPRPSARPARRKNRRRAWHAAGADEHC